MTHLARLLAVLALAAPLPAPAQTTTIDGVTLTLAPIATDLDAPVFLTAPKDDPRLFIVEQPGRIRILQDGALRPEPFLDNASQISSGGERGLLGLAFHPAYATNHRFYTYATAQTGDLQITEWTASTDPNLADPTSARPLLTISHRRNANHNGGWLGFGPDGHLYIATGDGGGAGDRQGNAQNPQSLLGKLLRLNVDEPGATPEIVALGLRNPWRPAFDGATLYIADVGQNAWEEVNIFTTPGTNYGWNLMEADRCFKTPCDAGGLTPPIHSYSHDQGCSITGGYVYRGQTMPALQGRYLFSDFCSGTLMSLRYRDGSAQDLTTANATFGQVTSFGQDATGELYLLTIDGNVAKLTPN